MIFQNYDVARKRPVTADGPPPGRRQVGFDILYSSLEAIGVGFASAIGIVIGIVVDIYIGIGNIIGFGIDFVQCPCNERSTIFSRNSKKCLFMFALLHKIM